MRWSVLYTGHPWHLSVSIREIRGNQFVSIRAIRGNHSCPSVQSVATNSCQFV